MCNLYAVTTNRQAIIDLTKPARIGDDIGNLEPHPGVFPNQSAPIVRNTPSGRELAQARWGLPTPPYVLLNKTKARAEKLAKKEGREIPDDEFKAMMKVEPDRGLTNVRKTASKHWTQWSGIEHRCVVPFTSFAEPGPGGNHWFAANDTRPLMFFAGLWVPQWRSVRAIKTGIETIDLFGFLTTDANAEVGAIHPKAMPAILKSIDEIETWLTAPWEDAQSLQQPLPDGTLTIVAQGQKQDTIA